jgi:hypothetical protein
VQGNGTEADQIDFQAMLEALRAKLKNDGLPFDTKPTGTVQTGSPSKSAIML